MSGTRKKVDLDYKILHREGRRVVKDRTKERGDMAASSDLHTQAIHINTDIDDLFESYDIGELCDEDELVDYLAKIEDLKKQFRRVYAEIRNLEGENLFLTTYPNYDKELDYLKSKFNEAKQKLASVRKAAKDRVADEEKVRYDLQNQKILQEMVSLKKQDDEKRSLAISSWEFAMDQICWFLDECYWETFSVADDVQRTLSALDNFVDKFSKAFAEMKAVLAVEDLSDFHSRHEKVINTARDRIRLGAARLQDIRADEALTQDALIEKREAQRKVEEDERALKERIAEEQKVESLMGCAFSLQSEIKKRYVSLAKKCKVDPAVLSDHEVLDLRKKEDSLSSELREILDKISSLIQYVVPCGKVADDLRNEVLLMQDDVSSLTDDFLKKVHKTIIDRDISEKKLKNAAGLNIQIPKFKGYLSEMNIYTLRTEFKKLIEPELQKSLWADYLKKNCLAGPALNLVSNMEDIDLIWAKLIEVYGNHQLLLQNKLGSLSKFSNLESVTDDEKIAFALASVLNTMEDLRKLAEEYDLTAELYYGGGLQRVLELIGKDRERRFIRKTVQTNLKNDQKWIRLVEFLKGELREREAYVLSEKSRKPLKKSDSKKSDLKIKDDSKNVDSGHKGDSSRHFPNNQVPPFTKCKCMICGSEEDHVLSYDANQKPYVSYVACQKFVDMTCKERDKFLFSKKWCSKCLMPGVKFGSPHDCDQKFLCTQKYLRKSDNTEQPCSKHVLVCPYHCDDPANKQLLEKYRKDILLKGSFFDFSKKVTIGFSEVYEVECSDSDHMRGVFEFQTIVVAPGVEANNFYDNGCGGMVARKGFVDKLALIGRATLIRACEVSMDGVNGQTSVAPHGIWSIRLRMKNGKDAVMIGAVVDAITAPFPKYPLGKVEEDIHRIIGEVDPTLVPKLPALPDEVGGEVDLMFGRDYLKYTPREITRLDSGLTIYDSMFRSPDGSTGVVAGPHPEFERVERLANFHIDRKVSFYTAPVLRYLSHLSLYRDAPLIGDEKPLVDTDVVDFFPQVACPESASTNPDSLVPCHVQGPNGCVIGDLFAGESGVSREMSDFRDRCSDCKVCAECKAYVARPPKGLKEFEKTEEAGSNISYRCIDCRKCTKCKKGASVEEMSIRQEYEQSLIDRSVTLDPDKDVCIATLPFLDDPDQKLVDNVETARKVYNNVVRTLAKNPDDLQTVLEAEAKLQRLGFVDWMENLSEEDQRMILDADVRHYYAWRIAWSESLTTSCRPVFDGSMPTPGGTSLNDILAKGTNNMNNLVEMIIRWSIKMFAYHTDVSKCYNAVKLDKNYWRFQLYLYDENLDPNKEPRTKVIKTPIYGAVSSGNQSERALRLTADTYQEEYPMAHGTIHNDTYVDDCLSGESTEDDRDDAAQQLEKCLAKGGFSLKGFTFSGQDPDPELSSDGKSIKVAGLKWYSKDDHIMLNIKDIKFGKKIRGRRITRQTDNLDRLTLKNCVSMIAQVFDPTGKITPLTAGFKLDVSFLHRSGLKWDDEIPKNLLPVWHSNLDMIKEIGCLRYKRAIVPCDAKSLDIVTIDAADASASLICAAIYVRFEKKDGTFSCQLVFSRSKVLPEATTTPRGELMAATLNAATGHIVKRAFGDLHKRSYKLTDSTVALHWICGRDTVLKTWVRNRSVECNRLCSPQDWFYVDTKDNVSDMGTRKGVKVADVADGSTWTTGLPWMSGPEEDFPIHSLEQLKLNQQEMAEVDKETMVTKTFHAGRITVDHQEDEEIQQRYKFSEFLIDPNRFRFRKIVRIFALVLTFIWNISAKFPKIRQNTVFTHTPPGGLPDVLKCVDDRYLLTTSLLGGRGVGVGSLCPGGKVVEVLDKMLQSSMTYFSIKASNEVKRFVSKSKYEKVSKEIDGILYYTGRILEDYEFGGYPDLCSAAIDLCSTTFCVPLMDHVSPVAIAIALEVHWHHPDVQHKGIESILRQMLRVAHIVGGRQLAVSIKQGCKKCRILHKRSVDVAMGPIQDVNLCIAPPFYASQVDLFGPFKTYSYANQRAKLSIWFAIFCCTTTGAVDIRAMNDYSTDSVVMAFIRFSCRYGFPKYLLPDSGSQLLKSCKEMRYSYTDTKHRLSFEHGVDFAPCPVGAHYVHGKVERKIQEVKKSVDIHVRNQKLNALQWETLMHQISNSINNVPIGLKNTTRSLENLDLITPNRLILGRNNERSPNAPLIICDDHKRMIETNANIFRAWFKAWLISVVPSLIERPKWHHTGDEVNVGDIILFLKNEKEYDEQYQYGRVSAVHRGKDGLVRKIDITYKNYTEQTFRTTHRTVREIVVIHPIDEVDVYERLDHLI